MARAFEYKVDTATEGHWSFMQDPEAMSVIDDVASQLSFQWGDHVERGDVENDALLWVAVRPKQVEKLNKGGSYRQFFQDLRSGLSKRYADEFQFSIAEFNEEAQ